MAKTKTRITLTVSIFFLVIGALIFPRLPADVDADKIIDKVLQVKNSPEIVDEISKARHESCKPILEGSDSIDGHDSWAIRFKPPVRKYPWIEVWVDKQSSVVLAYKELGRRNGRVVVLRQSPKS